MLCCADTYDHVKTVESPFWTLRPCCKKKSRESTPRRLPFSLLRKSASSFSSLLFLVKFWRFLIDKSDAPARLYDGYLLARPPTNTPAGFRHPTIYVHLFSVFPRTYSDRLLCVDIVWRVPCKPLENIRPWRGTWWPPSPCCKSQLVKSQTFGIVRFFFFQK